MPRKERRLAVIDAETDPFEYGRVPQVFAWGFYDGVDYRQYWGDNATYRLIADLREYPDPLYIYAHNGGKFDFFYLLSDLENPIRIINGRLVSATLDKHELRDSYAILPIPLAAWSKSEIDYRKFERAVREKHKQEILEYLRSDCFNLYSLVQKFVDRFGVKLTIGSTAIKELQRFHRITRGKEEHDKLFRPYYFGGRVEAFKRGALKGNWKIYDVNSMYPHAMRNFKHPSGTRYNRIEKPRLNLNGSIGKWPIDHPYFIRAICRNDGVLPVRTKEGLRFDIERGEFFVCSHELIKGLAHGTIEIISTIEAYVPFNTISFGEYVDSYMAEKIASKQTKDKANETFAKLILNSSYGKFGQNPENYADYLLIRKGEPWPSGEWELLELHATGSIWSKPSPKSFYFDVAIAASITSASRSVLYEAMQAAAHIVYCDTDSVICESLSANLSDTELGAWKLEASGDLLFIGGKKLYALFDGPQCVKAASKGVRLTGTEIAEICAGAVPAIRFYKDAPNFKLTGRPNFVDRLIQIT